MDISWIVALIYFLIYSIAIILTKYKATARLAQHKRRRSSIKKSLIQYQQNLTPNPARIDEKNPTNPTKAPSTPQLTTPPDYNRRVSESGTVDLTQLHQQLYTSVPYGAPVSNYEIVIAILHSADAGMQYHICIHRLIYLQIFCAFYPCTSSTKIIITYKQYIVFILDYW